MLKSMTAFGRASLSSTLGRFSVEIQSVNRKHLEVSIFLPRQLSRFENDIRKIISRDVHRGQVAVKVFCQFENTTPVVVTPNVLLAKQMKDVWQKIAHELELDFDKQFSLALLQGDTDVISYDEDLQNEEGYRKEICQTVEEALKQFLRMRSNEGASLQEDIEKRLKHLQLIIAQITTRSPGATEKYRQKLLERLQEVLPGAIENEERILREVCLFAERIDITEEITRFHSHMKQCEQLIKMETGSVGKTFEFVLQELNREINTIGSKSSDVEIAKYVIEAKSELEKIREQIQNVE